MIPSLGRIVHYRLNEYDAVMVNRRRADAQASAIASATTGAVVHAGNATRAGDVFPMMIVRVWADEPTEITCVQGQVFLDGNDTLWVTSRQQGDAEGQWFEPPRV